MLLHKVFDKTGGGMMENELATLGVILAAVIVPISTIAMLKVHNANK